jgi:hypothetical protein
VIVLVIIVGTMLVLLEEAVRWLLRPEGRRLRAIKKIGGRR